MNKHTTYQQLRDHLAYLKLAATAEHLPAALQRAEADKPSYTQLLHDLLAVEVTATEERRLAGRLRLAGFPSTKTLEEFEFDAQPPLDRRLVDELATLRFIEEKANTLLIGPPGVGKTMLAIALALKAVQAGYRVYYTTAADLVARTTKAAIEGRWQTTMRFWNGPQLLVIDELGYLPMPGEAASHLFQGISRRYEHGSIILTTNPGIASWGARSSKTPPSPPRSSTASCTTPPSCRSTATATACAATAPACRASERASTTHHRVGNSRDRTWGIPTIVDKAERSSSTYTRRPSFRRAIGLSGSRATTSPSPSGDARWLFTSSASQTVCPDQAARNADGHAYLILGVEPGTYHGMPVHDAADLENWLRPYVGDDISYDIHDVTEGDGVNVLVVRFDPPKPGHDIHSLRRQ